MPTAAARRLYLPPGTARRLVPRWVGPMVALGLVVLVGAVFGGVYWEGFTLRREAARLVGERDELRRQNTQLREEIRLLHTPEYIERIAREQLGLVRPGEIAVILVRPTPGPAKPSGGADESDGWWARVRRRLLR